MHLIIQISRIILPLINTVQRDVQSIVNIYKKLEIKKIKLLSRL